MATRTALLVAALLTLVIAPLALAQDRDREPPRHPPREALEACEGLEFGEACSFEAPAGTLEGTCWAPDDLPLACRPDDASAPPDRG